MSYERQQALGLQPPSSVAVVGCGGVGSWVALFLAMSGVEELWLFDHDTISDSNLNRVLATEEEIGKEKAEAVKALVVKYRPNCTVYACGMFTKDVAEGIGLDVQYVVAATDSVSSRREIAAWARGERISYLEVGAEGEIGSITGEPADFVTPEDSQPGYASVPVWLGAAVSSAVMAVSFIVHGANPYDNVLRAGWTGSNYALYDSSKSQVEEPDNEPTESQSGSTDAPF